MDSTLQEALPIGGAFSPSALHSFFLSPSAEHLSFTLFNTFPHRLFARILTLRTPPHLITEFLQTPFIRNDTAVSEQSHSAVRKFSPSLFQKAEKGGKRREKSGEAVSDLTAV